MPGLIANKREAVSTTFWDVISGIMFVYVMSVYCILLNMSCLCASTFASEN